MPQFAVKGTLLKPIPKIMKYSKSESLKQLPEASGTNSDIVMAWNFNIMIILRAPAHVDNLKMNFHFYWTPYCPDPNEQILWIIESMNL